MQKCDFHTHSTASDGILTPTEIVKRAYNNNVKYLALTDHDTISGINEAKKVAKDLSIHLIPGIELSTELNDESIHILGFFKDSSYLDAEFIEFLNTMENNRLTRAKKMIEKLKINHNIEISYDSVYKKSNGIIARPHIAREIIASGYNYDFNYIFDNFIGKDCPSYVPTTKITPKEGIEFLHKHNALVFLAHPKFIKKTPIEEFLKLKFDGIEAIYFQNTEEEEKYYLNIAKENNLLVSAGSDCHGNFVDDYRHGDIGSMNYPSLYLEKFLDALNIKKAEAK